ncbi:peroxisome-assembly ATPase [Malassezia sp. CBS 17886]|nr:peroxisome-assembly ATPase [Malassezia sp. CBS 17886]
MCALPRGPAWARPAAAFAARRIATYATSARGGDFYAMLELPRDATKAQIKSQFYKLSKKYHPDRSSSEDATARFQAVSEAYGTLSDDKARVEYDRKLGSGRGSGTFSSAPTMDADNLTRRKTANYAWAYQQRMRKNDGTRRSSPADDAMRRKPRHGDAANLYARMAQREQRRETREQAHPGERSAGHPMSFRAWSQRRWSEEEHRAEMSSTVVRFAQVGAIVGGSIWLSAKMLGG